MRSESFIRSAPAALGGRAPRERLAAVLSSLRERLSVEAIEPALLAAPALVFAPHPDDEVLGCGGTIALKADAGASIKVVVMTGGHTSHARFVDKPTLVHMRQCEAEGAAEQLGLSASDYCFLGFDDQALGASAAEAIMRVLELLRRHSPQQVFVPHRFDGLADHVATFEIVRRALQECGARVMLYEYPVWLWHTWPWTSGKPLHGSRLAAALRRLHDAAELSLRCRASIDVRPVLERKLAALAEYRSQTRRPDNEAGWPILADVDEGGFLQRCLSNREVFRRTPFPR